MTSTIEITNATKRFGNTVAVDDLSLSIDEGAVFGFLGPNGAGKSTTIRMLMDLIRPTSGDIKIFGESVINNQAVRAGIGYVPGELVLWDSMNGMETINYFAGLKRCDTKIALSLAERLEVDLHKSIRSLSRGNKQKIGLIQALMHQPRLLLLDEPTSGLDPLIQQEFVQLLREHTSHGGTVFLSSHVLSEVQHTAETIGIIRKGRLVAVEDVEELRAKAARRMKIVFKGPVPADELSALEGVTELHVTDNQVTLVHLGIDDAVIKLLANYAVLTFESSEPDLEDLFINYYETAEAPTQ